MKFKLWPKLFNRILAKRRDFRIVRIFAILEQLRQEYPEDLPILFRNRSLAEVCKSSELELFGNCIVDWSTVEWDGEPVKQERNPEPKKDETQSVSVPAASSLLRSDARSSHKFEQQRT